MKQKNQPLPFELLAPWPAGIRFMAGGLPQYIGEQTFILAGIAAGAAGGWLGALAALVWATATSRTGSSLQPRSAPMSPPSRIPPSSGSC